MVTPDEEKQEDVPVEPEVTEDAVQPIVVVPINPVTGEITGGPMVIVPEEYDEGEGEGDEQDYTFYPASYDVGRNG